MSETIDKIRSLPDKKLKEIYHCTAGHFMECPECGVETAFVGRTGYNNTSECHNCGYERSVTG